jgi:RHS repeat-associated protein
LRYTLSDHLGSTTVSITGTGSYHSELRYKPWGETRYSAGSPPTQRQFTGQVNESQIGLYFFNARWYDPALGRFTSADSLVPEAGNPQAWDRYAFVYNNPVRYVDPSGHLVCSDPHVAEGDCSDEGAGLWRYDISLIGKWSKENRLVAQKAAYALGSKLSEEIGGTPWEAFKKIYRRNVNFTWGLQGARGECATITAGGCTTGAHQINFMSLAQAGGNKTVEMAAIEARNNVIHELAHAFALLFYQSDGNYDPGGPYVNIPAGMLDNDGFYPSPQFAHLTWRQHPCTAGDYGCAHEVFADMALGWTFDLWASNPFGEERDIFMTINMTEWISALAER